MISANVVMDCCLRLLRSTHTTMMMTVPAMSNRSRKADTEPAMIPCFEAPVSEQNKKIIRCFILSLLLHTVLIHLYKPAMGC